MSIDVSPSPLYTCLSPNICPHCHFPDHSRIRFPLPLPCATVAAAVVAAGDAVAAADAHVWPEAYAAPAIARLFVCIINKSS